MTARTVYTTIDSPLGELLLVGEESPTAKGGTALASLSLPGQKGAAVVRDGWRRDPAAFEEIGRQLGAYFEGRLTHFEIEYVDGGTEFQRRVWQALEEIPYGATATYGQIARAGRHLGCGGTRGGDRDRAQSPARGAAVSPGDRRGRRPSRIRGRAGAQAAAARARGRARGRADAVRGEALFPRERAVIALGRCMCRGGWRWSDSGNWWRHAAPGLSARSRSATPCSRVAA